MKVTANQIRFAYVVITGLTLFYVLYIFEAFGIQQGLSYSGHGFLERSIWFSLLNLAFYALTEYAIAYRLKLNTIAKTTLWLVFQLIIGGSLIHLLFNYFWNWNETTLNSYLLLLSEYFGLMIIPMLVYHAIRLKGLTKHSESDLTSDLRFASENGKDAIQLKPDFLLFIKSDKNYLEIYFETESGTKTHLIRNRLKLIEEHYMDSPFLKRSHRSYLVNPTKVDKMITVKGKYELHLAQHVIPLSDSFVPSFQQA